MVHRELPKYFIFLNFLTMFLPLFIAILLGLVSPSTSTPAHDNGVVVITSDASGDDDGTGGGNPPTTGENGQLPPPKP